MIAILVAVKQELKPILQRADADHEVRLEHLDFHEGTFAGQAVALLALGVGKECARIAAEMTIKCYRPDLVISAGFGGGLAPGVRHGDIVIGTEILELNQDAGDQVRYRSILTLPIHDELKDAGKDLRLHFGKILTSDEIVLRAVHKQRLGHVTGAMAADMETSAVAAVCAAHHTDMLAVRCISDVVDEDLPEEFNDFFVMGQLQPGRIISSCSRRPRLFLDLGRIGYHASHAGKNLARFLATALPQLKVPALAARDL